jgi:hypothetical protein
MIEFVCVTLCFLLLFLASTSRCRDLFTKLPKKLCSTLQYIRYPKERTSLVEVDVNKSTTTVSESLSRRLLAFANRAAAEKAHFGI